MKDILTAMVQKIIIALEALIIIGILACIFSKPIAKAINPQETVITVADKKIKGENYLVYGKTEDGNVAVFEVSDSVLMFRFNSSDVFGALEEGHKYKIETRGFRIRLLTWYPNIYEYEEL